MNIISRVLYDKRKSSTSALIPFITAGYPSIDMTYKLLHVLNEEGADIIELGIPYSESLADGPLIQHASKVALQQGIYIDQVLSMLNKLSSVIKVPIIIFSYYNPILSRGVDKFINEISSLGVKGLIIPDLPIEETDYLLYLCNQCSIELILFIAPTSSSNRISNILSKSTGCVYLVSSTGVTGIRKNLNYSIQSLSSNIVKNTNKLTMLGFGISNAYQVSQVSSWNIDGIVIGSAFTQIISKYSDCKIDAESSILLNVRIFCRDIKLALK
uniref:Tryptophan synthase alpha chain n=1 Tax=Cliftonaea pectinata TaxID=2007206 RepID=A0A1Z1MQA0_9FLOR|nr:Tryptophan synthase alpha subunit [Cliftonaea pectinata]ARW68039.1 Tryptophan synthase alpha subunit [Cliftonaea pectinata]